MYRFEFKDITSEQTNALLETRSDSRLPYLSAAIIRTPIMYSSTTLNTLQLRLPNEDYYARVIELGKRCMDLGLALPAPQKIEETEMSYSKRRVLRPLESMSDWQDWVAERWLYPVGSDEAHTHFQGKILEELDELRIEISTGNARNMLAEMGDVLFCMTAQALNEGIDAAQELADYYPEVANVRANPETPILISEIKSLADSEDISWCTLSHKVIAELNDKEIHRGLSDIDTKVCLSTVSALASVHMSAARVHRNVLKAWGDDFSRRDPWIQIKASRIEQTTLDMMRFISLVSESLGFSLEEVIRMVQEKQWSRISHGKPLTKSVSSGLDNC